MTTALAHSNIALVKYWGKRDARLNLPAAGSLSMALDGLSTITTVTVAPSDEVLMNGAPARPKSAARVVGFLDLVRERVGRRVPLRVETRNDFPTAAGLASSASGFAALTMSAAGALGATLEPDELSELARQGSGSAARSIPGGWVRMEAGNRQDGRDAFAHSIAPAEHWDLRCVVLVTVEGEKDVSSTDGMDLTAQTSPYYGAWIESVNPDLAEAELAVLSRDFAKLATVAERSCLRMHASALAADPGVLYWNGSTVELVHRVRALRRRGDPVFFTIDAGPHVKVFCEPHAVQTVLDAADDLIVDHFVSRPGGPAIILDDP